MEFNTLLLSKRELQIVSIILQHGGSIRQKQLCSVLNISRSALSRHIAHLQLDKSLIQRTIVETIGNAKLVEISLNPNRFQELRKLLGRPSNCFTLISGIGLYQPPAVPPPSTANFTSPPISHEEAVIMYNELVAEKYLIDNIIIFGSPQSNFAATKNLLPNHLQSHIRFLQYPFEDYQNPESRLFKTDLEMIIQEELKKTDLIFDLTPLTKLWTIKLLDYAKDYKIPACYLSSLKRNDLDAGTQLIWVIKN
jgi:hypothetical protein